MSDSLHLHREILCRRRPDSRCEHDGFRHTSPVRAPHSGLTCLLANRMRYRPGPGRSLTPRRHLGVPDGVALLQRLTRCHGLLHPVVPRLLTVFDALTLLRTLLSHPRRRWASPPDVSAR
jgi:hypothetical protein